MKQQSKKQAPKQLSLATEVLLIFFTTVVNLRSKKVVEVIVLTRRIISLMTGNPDFPTPNPTLLALTGWVDELEARESVVQRGGTEADLIQRDVSLKKVIDAVTQLGAYVENVSGGDPAKILGAGFEVRNTPAPIEMGQVTDLKLERTQFPGQLNARWKKMRGTKTYRVQLTTTVDVESSWVDVAFVTRAQHLLTELAPNTYWVRVAAIGSLGQGPWSDPGRQLVI